MPYRTTRTKRQHLQPLMSQHYTVAPSRTFDRSYIVDDGNGEKWLYAGLVIAVDTATDKYVPYSAAASYGAGSDTPAAVTIVPYDLTYGAKVVTGVSHAQLVEDNCYLYGSANGSIPAAAKAVLDDIEWV